MINRKTMNYTKTIFYALLCVFMGIYGSNRAYAQMSEIKTALAFEDSVLIRHSELDTLYMRNNNVLRYMLVLEDEIVFYNNDAREIVSFPYVEYVNRNGLVLFVENSDDFIVMDTNIPMKVEIHENGKIFCRLMVNVLHTEILMEKLGIF